MVYMAAEKLLKIGHTGITWKDVDIEEAVSVIAEFGFVGVETFGWVLENLEAGNQSDLFARYKIPLVSAYCSLNLVDDEKKDEAVDKLNRWIALMHKHDCKVVALGGDGVNRKSYNFNEVKDKVIENVNDIGKRLADQGILCSFHPHTGTPIQTEYEIRTLIEAVDPKYVAFAPDVGQIQKGGTDALQIVKDYYTLIKHVHLKDYIGGEVEYNAEGREIDKSGFLGYTPLGEGVVDLKGILDLFVANNFDGYIMVELDGRHYANSGYSLENVKESARINKLFLENGGYK
jgi:inosose dehydratase